MKISKKIKPIPGFHAVEFFRKIKAKISKDIYGMTHEQMNAYFANTPDIFAKKPKGRKSFK